MKKLCLAALLAAVGTGAALAASPKIKPIFDVRLRWEGLDTPARTAAVDRSYNLNLARARVGVDAAWTHWTLRGLIQGAAAWDLPEAPAFGAGANYLSANDSDTDPSQLGIAELSATYTNGGFKAVLGRQPYVDGNEVATGVAHLDAIKRRLLSDRLIGVFEWPNVGRRFDGASAGYAKGGSHLAGFALRPLDGAFDFEDAFDEIDDLTVYGATLTGKHGAWIPSSEVRVFAVQYEDGREVSRRQTGGDLSITTAGASLLYGNDNGHALVWAVLQSGEWGASDQEAWAYIVNVGRNFKGLPGKPMIHLGLEQSSGDDGPGGAHETFFNVLPTNHKFYGIMDYVDWPNLRDLYIESFFSIGTKTRLRVTLHDFSLTETTDAWYGGSGAFEEESFGYAARIPVSGRYPSKDLGRELDFEVTYALPQGLQLGVGGGYFDGGDAAEAFVPVESDGTWTYLELSWKQ
jgi:hypothetical protein